MAFKSTVRNACNFLLYTSGPYDGIFVKGACLALSLCVLIGCQQSAKNEKLPITPQTQQWNMMSFVFDSEASAPLASVTHDRIEARVTSSTGAFPDRITHHAGALRAGLVITVADIPRLSGIEASLTAFKSDQPVSVCVSNQLDLQKYDEPVVRVSLTCTALLTPDDAPAIINPEVYINPTVDLDLTLNMKDQLASLSNRIKKGGIALQSSVMWAGNPATIELLLTNQIPESDMENKDPSQGELSALLRVTEALGQTTLMQARTKIQMAELEQRLRQSSHLDFTGVLNGSVKNGSAISTQIIPVTVRLRTQQVFMIAEPQPPKSISKVETPDSSRIGIRTDLTVLAQGDGHKGVKNGRSGETDALADMTATLLEPLGGAVTEKVRIATYNVENFWDDVDGNSAPELTYAEYNASESNYIDSGMPAFKARQVALVLSLAGTPDIVGFQELESAENTSRSLEILSTPLRKQGYRYFALGRQSDDKPVSVTTGFASKHPIVLNENLRLDYEPEKLDEKKRAELRLSARDPQVVEVLLPGGVPVRIYNSHWKSKRGDAALSEGMREAVGRLIADDIRRVRMERPLLDIVVLGDFNTDYTESLLSSGLSHTGDKRKMLQDQPTKELYNLWFDRTMDQRCSYSYSGQRTCIDHMLVTDTLYDTHGLQIVDGSFRVLGRDSGLAAKVLLGADGTPFRWQSFADFNETIHTGAGFSDHLPLIADFYIVGTPDTPLRKLRSDELLPESFSTTPVAPIANIPDQVPVCRPDEYVSAEEAGDLHLPQAWGKCIELQAQGRDNGADSPYQIRKAGRYSVKTRLQNGQEIGLSMTRAYDGNKDYLRNVLQNSSSDRVILFRGRVGWANGLVSILADQPAKDIQLESFERPCFAASHATVPLSSIQSLEQAQQRVGHCVRFEDQSVTIDDQTSNRSQQVTMQAQSSVGLVQIVVQKADLEDVTGASLSDLDQATIRITGFSALTSVTEEGLVFRTRFNGRQTGLILGATLAAGWHQTAR
jgi:hypothetical protein